MEFGWDDAKHERNIWKRGFGFDYVARIFGGRTIDRIDARFDYGEERMCAVGSTGDDVLFVVFTDRADVRWIISARRASRKERKRWQE